MMGGDSEMSILETAKRLIGVMHLDESAIVFTKDRPGQDRRYAIDFTKMKTELGWTPSIGFDEGLHQMVDWYRKNEAWWRPIKNGAIYREWYKSQFGDLA